MKKLSAPTILIIKLSIVIYVVETLIMLVIDKIHSVVLLPVFILDPLLLMMLLSPALFYLYFKPMMKNLAELDAANKKISSHRDILKAEVKLQTEALRESLEIQNTVNEALRLSVADIEFFDFPKKFIDVFLKTRIADCVNKSALIVLDKKRRYTTEHNSGFEESIFNELLEECKKGNFENSVKKLFAEKSDSLIMRHIETTDRLYAYGIIKCDYSKVSKEKMEEYISVFEELFGLALKRFSYEFNIYEEHQTLSAILQNVTMAVITANEKGEILEFNKYASKIFGFEPGEIVGKNLNNLMTEPESSEHDSYIQNYLKSGDKKIIGKEERELRGKRKNGEVFPLELSVNEFYLGNERVFVGSIADISRRKRDEYQLLLRNAAIDAAANSIVITNTKGIILYVNSAFTKFTGYSPDEAIGKKTNILKSGKHDRSFYENLWDTIKRGKIWNGRIVNKKKNGELYTEEMTITPVRNSEGEIVNYIAVKQDVTEEVERENRIRRYLEQLEIQKQQLESLNVELKEANYSKDKFFSIIAHDLKSPFSALLGYAQIFNEEFDELSREEIKTFTDSISAITKTIYQLILDLLDWARMQTGRMEMVQTSFNLYMITSGIVSMLQLVADKKNIKISLSGNKSAAVFADENMIKTVVRNLISNAIKFTYESGEIIVKIFTEGDNVVTCIEDTGIGMTEEEMDLLFKLDSHHTTKGTAQERGTGLGLILCKEMIEKNNGKIWVESEPGKGSKFYFSLNKAN